MRNCLPIVAVALTFCVGCGQKDYQTARVSGRITVNGKAYANIAVMFQPDRSGDNNFPGPGSTGVTDEDGNYSLKIVGASGEMGAAVGKHRVHITNYNPERQSPLDEGPQKVAKPAVQIPGKYGFQGSTKLEFEVKPGVTNRADFDLKAP